MGEWIYIYTYIYIYIHVFFTSALVEGERLLTRPGRFTPGAHSIGGWVDRRRGLKDVGRDKS
jgi:hypothetical protein